eukprot:518022_1
MWRCGILFVWIVSAIYSKDVQASNEEQSDDGFSVVDEILSNYKSWNSHEFGHSERFQSLINGPAPRRIAPQSQPSSQTPRHQHILMPVPEEDIILLNGEYVSDDEKNAVWDSPDESTNKSPKLDDIEFPVAAPALINLASGSDCKEEISPPDTPNLNIASFSPHSERSSVSSQVEEHISLEYQKAFNSLTQLRNDERSPGYVDSYDMDTQYERHRYNDYVSEDTSKTYYEVKLTGWGQRVTKQGVFNFLDRHNIFGVKAKYITMVRPGFWAQVDYVLIEHLSQKLQRRILSLNGLYSAHASIHVEPTSEADALSRKRLFVRCLGRYTKNVDLYNLFRVYGKVQDAYVINKKYRRSYQRRSQSLYGFVQFEKMEDAQAAAVVTAKELNGHEIMCFPSHEVVCGNMHKCRKTRQFNSNRRISSRLHSSTFQSNSAFPKQTTPDTQPRYQNIQPKAYHNGNPSKNFNQDFIQTSQSYVHYTNGVRSPQQTTRGIQPYVNSPLLYQSTKPNAYCQLNSTPANNVNPSTASTIQYSGIIQYYGQYYYTYKVNTPMSSQTVTQNGKPTINSNPGPQSTSTQPRPTGTQTYSHNPNIIQNSSHSYSQQSNCPRPSQTVTPAANSDINSNSLFQRKLKKLHKNNTTATNDANAKRRKRSRQSHRQFRSSARQSNGPRFSKANATDANSKINSRSRAEKYKSQQNPNPAPDPIPFSGSKHKNSQTYAHIVKSNTSRSVSRPPTTLVVNSDTNSRSIPKIQQPKNQRNCKYAKHFNPNRKWHPRKAQTYSGFTQSTTSGPTPGSLSYVRVDSSANHPVASKTPGQHGQRKHYNHMNDNTGTSPNAYRPPGTPMYFPYGNKHDSYGAQVNFHDDQYYDTQTSSSVYQSSSDPTEQYSRVYTHTQTYDLPRNVDEKQYYERTPVYKQASNLSQYPHGKKDTESYYSQTVTGAKTGPDSGYNFESKNNRQRKGAVDTVQTEKDPVVTRAYNHRITNSQMLKIFKKKRKLCQTFDVEISTPRTGDAFSEHGYIANYDVIVKGTVDNVDRAFGTIRRLIHTKQWVPKVKNAVKT